MKIVFSTCQPRVFAIISLGLSPRWVSLLVSSLLLVSGCNASGDRGTGASANPTSGTAAETVASTSPSEVTSTGAEDSAETGDGSDTRPTAPATDGTTHGTPDVEVTADSRLISASGIGPAQLGMTVSTLKQVLGDRVEFNSQSPFLADFDAIAVQQADDTLFYLLYLAGDPLGDGDVIQGILTTNPQYQTVAGVGVGTPLQTAEAAYGNATLSHSADNESREYVRFEQHPATNISFTTQPVAVATNSGSLPLAGTYTNPVIQYNETEEYRADASIEAVLLVCLSVSCSQGQE
ncbi:MAG: hypothetical protein AB4042_10615 [Leptolyngbyaceae cyanobacterium]